MSALDYNELTLVTSNRQTDTWVKEGISREIKKYFELNEKENTSHQIVCDAVNAMLRGEFIAFNAC